MADKLTVELEVLSKKALESVESFTQSAKKQLTTISVGSILTGVNSAVGLAKKAFEVFGDSVRESVGAAIEAEDATERLANSMRLVGDFSQTALQGFEEFAGQLALTSKASDDQVLSAIALAKSFQLTNKEARTTVAVASDLAAITGDSLESAVQKLSKTFGGTLTREMKALIPEFRFLTREQLANGEAVRIVSERFSGSAEAATRTFGGSIGQLTKAFGELAEEMGRSVTRNESIKSAIKGTTDATNELTASVAAGETSIKSMTLAFLGLLGGNRLDVFGSVSKSAKTATDETQKLLDQIKQSGRLGQAQASTDKIVDDRIKSERKFQEFREKAEAEFQGIKKDLETAGLTDIQKINAEAERKIKIVRDGALAGNIVAVKNQEKFIAAIRIDQAKKISEEQIKIRREAEAAEANFDREKAERLRRAFEKPAEVAFKAIIDLKSIEEKQVLAAGAGLLNLIKKGADGAAEFISQTVGAAASALFGEQIGGFVEQIIGFLSLGPEKVEQMVKQFIVAIPGVLKNIILAIPALVTAFVESIPLFIDALIKEVPNLINGIIAAFPRLLTAWISNIPKIANAFINGIIANIPNLIKGFAEGLVQAAKDFVNAIFDSIKSVGGLVGGGKGGGGIPIISDIGDFLGLADGGRIPDLPRFERDRFPARLSAGEQVLSKDLSSKLDAFLAGNRGGAPQVIQITIGQREMARVLLDLNRNGFRTA